MLASEKTSRSEEVEATAILMETVKVLGDLKNKGDENRVIECLIPECVIGLSKRSRSLSAKKYLKLNIKTFL